jgi:hypothetical protein
LERRSLQKAEGAHKLGIEGLWTEPRNRVGTSKSGCSRIGSRSDVFIGEDDRAGSRVEAAMEEVRDAKEDGIAIVGQHKARQKPGGACIVGEMTDIGNTGGV